MPSERGLVSIVVPVHNKKKAKICAEQVRKQTYPNIELIMVDFKGFPAEKRNYGYLRSKGEYVFFLDEDSYLSPSAISASVDKFKQGFDVVGIPAVKAEPRGYLAKCISVTRLGGAELKFFRRSVLQDVGLFHPEYALSDDLDMFVRIFRKGYRLGMVDPKDGYMIHDETNDLESVLRKILFARKSYKNLQKEYGQTLDALTQKPTERKRILKILSEQPNLILGVSFIMCVSFLARRIP
jgi:glycosyltransferase involved in cell wall biosynthesis